MKKNTRRKVKLTQELQIKRKSSEKKSVKKLLISLGSVVLVASAVTCVTVGIKVAKDDL